MIELPFPAKILWPNGRGHHMAKAREVKKHRQWAYHAGLAAGVRACVAIGPHLRLHATFHPKTAHAVDRDNAGASLKSYQDGIAQAMGIDDKVFAEPAISFAEPIKGGKVILTVEAL
jgi:crossover junction endodeoxyribonuclease RusA